MAILMAMTVIVVSAGGGQNTTTFNADILLAGDHVGEIRVPMSVTVEHEMQGWTSMPNNVHRHYRGCEHCDFIEENDCEYGQWLTHNDEHRRTCTICTGFDSHLIAWGTWSAWDTGNAVTHNRNRTCTVPGCTMTNEETGAHDENDIRAWTQGDDVNHSRARHCSVCSRFMSNELQAHTWPAFGNWTNLNATQHTRTRICTTVGCDRPQTETENHAWEWASDAVHHWQHCGTANNAAGTASRCGAEQNRAEHTWGAWSFNFTHHWQFCTHPNCTRSRTEDHNWGPWANQGDGTCRSVCVTNCGIPYRSYPHAMSGGVCVRCGAS